MKRKTNCNNNKINTIVAWTLFSTHKYFETQRSKLQIFFLTKKPFNHFLAFKLTLRGVLQCAVLDL